MIPHELILKVALALDLYFLLLTLYNLRFLRKYSYPTEKGPAADVLPRVSVILPARNEERRIRPCLESLLAQDYPNLEIVAVNDNSEDATGRIFAEYAARDDRLRVIAGAPLEPGWSGKSFACRQGVDAARGDYLLFTDADTVHEADSVSWAVQNIREHDAHFLSAYVRQKMGSLGELVIIPTIYIMTALLLPLGLIPRRNASLFSFAIGQFMICRADSFRSIGTYDRFKGSVVEDISMAREMKRAGYKSIFLDAQSHVSCRMYEGFGSAFRGIGKSLFGAINSSLLVLAVLMAIIGVGIEYPFIAAAAGVLGGASIFSAESVPVALFSVLWLLKLRNRRLPLLLILLYPVTFLVLLGIGLYSAAKTGFGPGLEWKGRLVTARARVAPPAGARRETIEIASFQPLYRLVADVVFYATLLLVYVVAKSLFGLKIEGREHLAARRRAAMLISNHLLYLDSAMVACAIFPRRTWFSALERTFSIPFVGSYIRMLGAFPLPEQDPLRQIAQPLRRMFEMGWFVHVFPEGELYHRNQEIRELRLGAFLLAMAHDAEIFPVTFVLLPRPLVNRVLRRAVRVKIVIQPPLDPRAYLAHAGKRSTAIREMADDARSAMMATIHAEHARLYRRKREPVA